MSTCAEKALQAAEEKVVKLREQLQHEVEALRKAEEDERRLAIEIAQGSGGLYQTEKHMESYAAALVIKQKNIWARYAHELGIT